VLGVLYTVLVWGFGLLFGIGSFIAVPFQKDPQLFRIWFAGQQLLNFLVEVLITPILLIGTSVYYFDLRVHKEGLGCWSRS